MRNYNYDKVYQKLLTPSVVGLLSQIHELKGEQGPILQTKKDTLTHLLELAKIQSADASNKIEGIFTSDDRLKQIVLDKTRPKNRNEKEIAGYRDVLTTIHQSYDYIPIKPGMILQLHRDLYKYSGMTIGGHYKNADNIIEEQTETWEKRVRFRPVPAWETAESMDALCAELERAGKNPEYDPLLLLPLFILDFLCIHPFNDGNGRMSRLLTLLLLYRCGYLVGQYISIEKLIEQSKETYYEVLQESSQGWHEEENDYAPFAEYLLGVILAAYREFSQQAKLLTDSETSKPDQIAAVIEKTLGKITKAEIMEQCPNISQVTVQRTLTDLQKEEKIIKLGGGRYTAYTWNREK